jgi:N-acyl-D-amino-acid deacylase
MSAGLSYSPGMFATDDELADLLSVVRDEGGYYCPHHRNYGTLVVESYQDCLSLAERAGVALHLAHCHVNFPLNRGRASQVLDSIDAATARGVDISLDAYPYLASATYLASFLPKWAHVNGPAHTMALLGDPVQSEALRHEVEVLGSDGNHGVPVDWDTVTISSTKSGDAGQAVSALAARDGVSPWAAVVRLLLEDELGTGCILAVGNEENMLAVMKHRIHTVGTDGILVGDRPHPRGWGSFPRFLGHYVQDLGVLSLEQAIAHVSGNPARRLGLRDRGVLAKGNWADVVVFDAATIDSAADYDHPTVSPTGIRLVLVNGVPVMDDGVRTAALPGRAIRRGTN